MFSKLYDTIKRMIKENLGFLITFFVLLIVFTLEFPYYIDTPGGIIDVGDRITIKGEYQPSGSFNLAYVSELKATIPTLLLAKLKKDWDIIPKSEVVASNERVEDVTFRDQLMLKTANQNAILVAYREAQKQVTIKEQSFYVTYIMEDANTTLQVQDQLLTLNEHEIKTNEDISSFLNQKKVGDTVTFEVIRNNKKTTATAVIQKEENRNIIGILATKDQTIEMDPQIEFHFKSSESGPSGGLMMTLAIYNYLIPEDLTKGRIIVGTGTIAEDGTVGSIDGVKYKLKGAIKAGADLFFVPSGRNYDEAKQYAKEQGYTIPIIPVKTFYDALEYLKQL